MVILLEEEITEYEPYGRLVISSLPGHRSCLSTATTTRQQQAQDVTQELEDELTLSNKLFSNLTLNPNFTIAELDGTRDLFRSPTDVSNAKDMSASFPKEFWRVRKSSKGEEELFVSGNSIICSHHQANNSGSAFLDKTFSFEEVILDAVWCGFIMSDSVDAIMQKDLKNIMRKASSQQNIHSMPDNFGSVFPKFSMSPIASAASSDKSDSDGRNTSRESTDLDLFETTSNLMAKALCAMDMYSIHIFTDSGDHFIKTLQFEVGKIVPTNIGLVFERNSSSDDYSNRFPVVFFLSNPLKEIVPMLLTGYKNLSTSSSNTPQFKSKSNTTIGYVTKALDLSLVDVIADMNLAIFYSSCNRAHVIFQIRPINDIETEWIQKDLAKLADYEENESSLANGNMSIGSMRHRAGSTGSSFMVSTPVSSSGEALAMKKGPSSHRMSYSMANPSPPITRSRSSTGIVFQRTPKDRPNSVGLASATASMINSPLIHSPLTGTVESPISPALNCYRGGGTRLLMEVDPELRSNIPLNDSNNSSSNYRTKTCMATPTMMKNTMNDHNVETTTYEPIIAEFALEFIWSEADTVDNTIMGDSDSTNFRAHKVFTTTDYLGQNYLALLTCGNVLKMIKFDQMAPTDTGGDEMLKKQFVFGTTKVLTAKDAEPLHALNMLLVLDEANNMQLFSGVHRVALVHLPGSNLSTSLANVSTTPGKTSHMSTPIVADPPATPITSSTSFCIEFNELSDSGQFNSKLQSRSTMKQLASSPIVASGSNITNNNTSVFVTPKTASVSISRDFQLCLNTPTIGDDSNTYKIVKLRDAVDNRVTLQLSNGSKTQFYRVTLPEMATTFLVDKCMAALRLTLPKEVGLSLLKCWYSFRSSHNSDETIPEVILFKLCLLSLIGYDLESAKNEYGRCHEIGAGHQRHEAIDSKSIVVDSNVQVGHSVSVDKEVVKRLKVKQPERESIQEGDDDDWLDLLENTSNLYGINRAQLIKQAKKKAQSKRTTSKVLMFNFDAPGELFKYVPDILTTLHLVYEDLKLVQINWSLCKLLVDILYLFAVDLDLPLYQDHYCRDFPDVCVNVDPMQRFSLSMGTHTQLTLLQQPPSIFSFLYQCLKKAMAKTTEKDEQQVEPVLFPYISSNGGCQVITSHIFNLVLLYANLASGHMLVEPSSVLRGIDKNCNHIAAGASMINIHKLRQIAQFFPSTNEKPMVVEPSLKISASSSQKQESQHPQKKKRRIQSAPTNPDDSQQKGLPNSPVEDEENMKAKETKRDPQERVLFLMSALGITAEYLKQLPLGIAWPLWQVIFKFRQKPKTDWCSSIYSLIDRPDLLSLEHQQSYTFGSCQSNRKGLYDGENPMIYLNDKHESELAYLDLPVLRLLFPNDQRLHDAFRLMIITRPLPLDIDQNHRENDIEFIERREKLLYALNIRMLAMALGRGMITLRSYLPVVAEKFPIPDMVMFGKVPGKSTLVDMSHIDVPPSLAIWPLFHNGVAAGLRINSNHNKLVDSSWVLFNKPSNSMPADDHYCHAGFLLALGLNGLLDNLSVIDFHDYLAKGNDLTKVAILLGLAASKRGTMDPTTYVMLGIHLDGLLPAASTAELDVSTVVKVAAVLGVGFLFQRTGNVHVAEVLLNEIGRPPGPDMEQYIDRESYALSAGLAFGLVTLGRGDEMIKMITSEGLSIPDQLNHYMLGVHKRASKLDKERPKVSNYHIHEGDCLNPDVTTPGSTLALGMMFFATGNRSITQWLTVPDTQNLLETMRPDFILLQVLAKNLILWDEIRPDNKWIESQIPPIIYKHAFGRFDSSQDAYGIDGGADVNKQKIDYETMSQSYCNIIAGACFALALRYAGSADKDASRVCKKYAWKLVEILRKGEDKYVEQAGASTIESCINVIIVSCSIIMAGTGDIEIFRLCRYLRSRVGKSHVLYGSYMAEHMALGLLFLGGCRMTLNSRPESVAALLCAFFPKYPVHSSDNRYHLQAFRHLYVLATEPRLLVPRCMSSSGMPVYAKIRYRVERPSPTGTQLETVECKAPCLLPDLDTLTSVELIDQNYWKISFEVGTNFSKLRQCLAYNGNLFIKRRVGDLSYNRDLVNFAQQPRSTQASFLLPQTGKINRKSFSLFDLTNEVVLKFFSEGLFRATANGDEVLVAKKSRLATMLYDCAEDETLELFGPLLTFITQFERHLDGGLANQNYHQQQLGGNTVGFVHKYFNMWQLKLISLFINDSNRMSKLKFIDNIRHRLEKRLGVKYDFSNLANYLVGEISLCEGARRAPNYFVEYVVYYDLPTGGLDDSNDFMAIYRCLKKCSPAITIGMVKELYRGMFEN